MADSRKQQYVKHLRGLKSNRTSFESKWQDIADYIDLTGTRFVTSERNQGGRKNVRIVDPTATVAARIAQSGMMSGITSPTRPWFALKTPDPDMMKFGPVKIWLDVVQSRMNDVFSKSNLYQSLPILYRHLLNFSTGSIVIQEDDEDVIRCFPLPVGSYYLANSDRLQVDTVYRKFTMTARQMVMRFGVDAVSNAVQSAWENGNYESWFDVVHVVEPNLDRDTGKLDSRNKRVMSVYFEHGGDPDKLLSESGYDEMPILSPRWEINGEDVYGVGAPGNIALGTVKALQLEQIRKANAIDKMVNPPMVGSVSLKNKRIDMTPGGVTYVDQISDQSQFRPAYLVNPQLNELLANIQDDRQVIKECYFNDLFAMFSTLNTRSMPVEAVSEMQTEKLLMLSPVIERLNDEFLNPLVDRTFSIMARKNLFPPAPPDLQGQPLRVEYTSVMAQAQKAVGISSIERFVGFVGNLAASNPNALDKLDVDQTIDTYGDMLGVSPTIIVSDDDAATARQQRAQVQQQQQALQTGMAAAQGVKTLSEANTANPSVLKTLSDAAQAAQAQQQQAPQQ